MAPIGDRIVTLTVPEVSESTPDHWSTSEQPMHYPSTILVTPSPPQTTNTKAMPFMGEDTFLHTNLSLTDGNNTRIPAGRGVASHDDATWILTSAFIIFTMQSGFGLLESGSVSSKNEVNIMVKNAVDVIFGGLSYWMFGFGLSFGEDEHSNPFSGWGHFFVSNTALDFGWIYSKFFFQASFATTATTIVSGAMAERTKLEAYIIFSFVNTFIFCIPAHWLWAKNGWLAQMGVIDIAGAGPVHLVGGITGLVATVVLKPRHNRYKMKGSPPMGSPSNAILGMFMLWWGWLGFNCGSTFGISGLKWKLAARSAVATICSSVAGGIVGLLTSFLTRRKQYDVPHLINGVLSALVSITGICALAQPWEAFIIGTMGALMSLFSIRLLDKLKIDDPVGCVGVHAVGGIWSMITGGLFPQEDILGRHIINSYTQHFGLFKGGGIYLLGVQLLAAVSIIIWTLVTSYFCLKVIDLIIGLRVSLEHEILGADLVEHGVANGECSFDKATNKITWFKTSGRSMHVCEECRRTRHQRARLPETENDKENVRSDEHKLTGEGVAGKLSRRGDTVEISDSLDQFKSYGSHGSTGSRTLGKKVPGRKLSSIRYQMMKKFRASQKRSQTSYTISKAKQMSGEMYRGHDSPNDDHEVMHSILPL